MPREKFVFEPGPLSTSYSGHFQECGLDEAGRGCLAGPVVAAAVLWPAGVTLPGLNDSKQLTEGQRLALEPMIKELATAWAVVEISPRVIDEINILQASVVGMQQAAEHVMARHHVDLLLVDGHYFKPVPWVAHLCMVKGDARFLSIAAASVLAKNHRDVLMREEAKRWPGYGWESNVGYPAPAHRRGLEEWGTTPLHRLSYTLGGRSLADWPKREETF